MAESGKFVHALRAVDLRLQAKPDDPELIELRTQLVAGLSRVNGKPTRLAATAEPPPPIHNRRAEFNRDYITETAEIAMIWIPPGSFLMCDPQGSDDDTFVTLSRGYWLGRTEVTQQQWDAVMENIPSPSHFKGSDRPVENVSWLSVMEFCRKFSEHERAAGRLPADYEYTLPTEAQWEYACRANTTTPYAGDLATLGWFELNSGGQTHPVAQKQPNAWGLYDMHGNVLEWCADGYGGYPGGHQVDPMNNYDGPAAGMARIMRGGGWGSSAGQARSAYRERGLLTMAGSGCGFRLALAPRREPPAGSKTDGSQPAAGQAPGN